MSACVTCTTTTGTPAGLWTLDDADLDLVAAGQGHKAFGPLKQKSTIIEIVNITIGNIIATGAGNSTVTVDVIGIGGNTTTLAVTSGRHHHS